MDDAVGGVWYILNGDANGVPLPGSKTTDQLWPGDWTTLASDSPAATSAGPSSPMVIQLS